MYPMICDTEYFGGILKRRCYVVGHQMPFQNLHSFVFAQPFYDIPDICAQLIVNYFSSILRSEHDMIYAVIFRVS